MFIHCELLILILAMTLNGQVHAGEIYGGHEAVRHSRPYMVLLELQMEDGTDSHCGGFLLNKDFVMTAAHCQAKSYTALLGAHNISNSNEIQRIRVEKTFPNKHYNGTDYQNDMMLLKLSSKAHFKEHVRPIPLADQDNGTLPKSCTVSGWGRSDRNKKYMTPVLMEANLALIWDENCDKKNLYCSEGETGPGQGDAGGPLVCEDGKAYGVVSTSSTPNSNGWQMYRYTKIAEHRNWISWIMEHNGKR